jgi:hypothetical protein
MVVWVRNLSGTGEAYAAVTKRSELIQKQSVFICGQPAC